MDRKNSGGIFVSDPFDSVTAFYIHYKRLLFQEAWKYLPQLEDVEDVVCETLTRLLENAGKFHAMESSHQIQYAKVIVRNLCYHHLRRSSYFTLVPFEDVDVYLPAGKEEEPEAVADRKCRIGQLKEVWAQIPPEDRLLLEQKYILDWSDETIAAGLQIKPQSVRMYLTRAKRRAAKQMREAGIQLEDWL
jgi:RNA polymerase sigma factor (sigma-70 family)